MFCAKTFGGYIAMMYKKLSIDDLVRHIKLLSSDFYEGFNKGLENSD